MGVNRKGEKTDAYQPASIFNARYTFFAEGCRGHLGKQLESKFGLRDGADPQVYGIGLKELWEISPKKEATSPTGIHSAGWPLDRETYGGSFLYHSRTTRSRSLRRRTWPFESLSQSLRGIQRTRPPAIRSFFDGGQRIAYGAARSSRADCSRAQNDFPGGVDRGQRRVSQCLAHQGESCAISPGDCFHATPIRRQDRSAARPRA